MAENGVGNAPPPGENDLISIHVPQAQTIGGVVYYYLTLSTPTKTWSCLKRYSQFEALHSELTDAYGARGFPSGCMLPPKRPKVLVSHVNAAFIEERRIILEHYLRRMNGVKEVSHSTIFRDFLTRDKLDEVVKVPTEEKDYVFPEDSEITDVTVPSTRMMSDHVLYQIDVMNTRKRKSFSKWTVLKRFIQFYDMDQQLRNDFTEDLNFLVSLPYPPSRQLKLFVDHMDEHFVEHRRLLLEHYLQKMIRIPQAAKNRHFLAFLGVVV